MNLKKFMNRDLKIEFESVIERPPGFYGSIYEGERHFLVTLKVYNRSIFPIKGYMWYTLGEYTGGCLYPQPSEPFPIWLPGRTDPRARDTERYFERLELTVHSADNGQIIVHLFTGPLFIKIGRNFKFKLSTGREWHSYVDENDPSQGVMMNPVTLEDVEANFRSAF